MPVLLINNLSSTSFFIKSICQYYLSLSRTITLFLKRVIFLVWSFEGLELIIMSVTSLYLCFFSSSSKCLSLERLVLKSTWRSKYLFLNILTHFCEIILIIVSQGFPFLKSDLHYAKLFIFFFKSLQSLFPYFFIFNILLEKLIVSVKEFVLFIFKTSVALWGCNGMIFQSHRSHRGYKITLLLIGTTCTIKNSNLGLHWMLPKVILFSRTVDSSMSLFSIFKKLYLII